MSTRTNLYWLPVVDSWNERLSAFESADPSWEDLIHLANHNLDFLQTNALDRLVRKHFNAKSCPSPAMPVRLAIITSSITSHLVAAIRVGALRRGIWCDVFEVACDRECLKVFDAHESLKEFAPTAILVALDSRSLADSNPRIDAGDVADQALETLQTLWLALRRYACPIFQNTLLNVFEPLLGNHEWQLSSSPWENVVRINAGMRALAGQYRVNIVAVDQKAQQDGVCSWYSPMLWHQSKQEIHPHCAPLYGDLLGRMLAAGQGRSSKCLVLDLDNTLWGGVIGDDGLEGIHLGPSSAKGEAYASFQEYVLRLSRRGIVLAVCSKNDEINALAPFQEQHPGMILSREDIVCFAANWQDKASNLRAIAKFLNIGLDALVFVDDSPYERERIRCELPMVAVPELPEDASLYAACLSSAGYFEALTLTAEDYARNRQYKARIEGELFKVQADDEAPRRDNTRVSLFASPFDQAGIHRIVQLINKTNQFNFTTRRYSYDEVQAMMADAGTVTCQISLSDNFGDSGIICIIIGKELHPGELHLDTFLMSCRVLGRQIEGAALDIIACQAATRGLTRLIGYYRPTERNGMVRDLYARLGFTQMSEDHDGGSTWELDLNGYQRRSTRPLQGRCNFREWFEKRAAEAGNEAGILQS